MNLIDIVKTKYGDINITTLALNQQTNHNNTDICDVSNFGVSNDSLENERKQISFECERIIRKS
eukprot:Pgem_evm1s7925